MVNAVIFDMDGLMFDTEVLFKNVFSDLLNERGIECDPQVIEAMIGIDSRTIARFEDRYPGITETMQEFIDHRSEYFFKYFRNPGDADKKGLKELTDYLNESDIPYAIGSSSLVSDIERFIAYSKADLKPKAIVSSKQAGMPAKPDPAVFLHCAEELHVSPAECLVLEDGKYGIIAAKRGGMLSCFIKDQVEPDEEMKAAIRYERSDLSQVIDLIKELNR